MYKIYMTDAIKEGLKLNLRYVDLIAPVKDVSDDRSPEEIIDRIRLKIRKLNED